MVAAKKRVFSVAEANHTLPLVRRIVVDILQVGQQLRAMGAEAERGPDAVRARELAADLHELLGELAAIGCSFRDWSLTVGLVDFPAIIDGEEVLLCWRSDEPAVGHFHGVQAGYAGRRPLPVAAPEL